MRPPEDWDEGPSVLIGPEAELEDEEPQGPGPGRPGPEKAGQEPVRPRSSFGIRLLYVLIFSVLVLTALVVYAVMGQDRADQLGAARAAQWASRIESLENRVQALEEKLQALSEQPPPAAAPKKK
ncbi:MAG: hypothetical protein JRJ59_06660 [Deltaproteobacteria bacterium]|nr:hypothetical protein [Deltaproteobacteria bacterium]